MVAGPFPYWVDRIDHGVVGQRENPHCICPHSNLAFKIEILFDNFFKGYFEVDFDVNVDVDNYVDAVVSVVVNMLYYHLSGRRETSQQKNGY